VTEQRFQSIQGDNPAWPVNRLVTAYLKHGWQLDAHRGNLNGAVQAAKGPCPCSQHATPGRDFAFAEYPNGRVRVWSFTGCDTRICLEAVGLTHGDLQTGPDGQILPADDIDPTAPHLAPVPEYPVQALTGPLADLVDAGTSAGLPAPLVAGAGLAALAAVSGMAELRFWTWEVRPALWVPLVAPPGGGKTPAIDLSRRPIRELDSAEHKVMREQLAEWNDTPRKERGERPGDQTRLVKDITVEAVARWLDRGDGTGGLDTDELADFLRSMNRYRKGGGTDAGKWLELWSTQPWRYQRVDGDLDLYIARPVLAVSGGIQPELVHLLGQEGDGMRPRWLPHISLAHRVKARPGRLPTEWNAAVAKLYQARGYREWSLAGPSLAAWERAADRWHAEGDGAESPSAMYALAKADIQCARVALVLAEAAAPGAGGEIPVGAVSSAVEIVDFVLNCWRALPGSDHLSYSRKDDALYGAVEKLATWIEQRGECVTKRQIRRACPAGIRDSAKLDEVLRAYESVYPGSVRAETPEDRAEKTRSDGPYGILVFAPRRGGPRARDTGKRGSSGLSAADSPPNPSSRVPADGAAGQSDPGWTVGTLFPADSPVPAVAEPFQPGTVIIVESSTDLEAALAQLLAAPAVGLDIETTGLDPMTADIRLIQMTTPAGTYVIDCYSVRSAALALQPVIDRAPALVVHDGVFDFRHLVRDGVALPPDLGDRVRDTALASRLLTAGDRAEWNSLAEVVTRHLGVGLDKSLQTSDWSRDLTTDQVLYAATDAAVLLPLRDTLSQAVAAAQLGRVAQIENRCLPAMVWLVDSGAPFDIVAHSAAAAEIDQEVRQLQQLLDQEVANNGGEPGINYRSPKQLLAMFAALGFQLTDTAEETLKKVDHPIARLLLRYREATKLQSTYGRPLAEAVASDGRIHAKFSQIGADSGRMSCSGPNLQQVPKAHGFRRMFRAPAGRKLIKADYSQIELRIAAEISGDTELIEAFSRGDDLHQITAQRVLGKDTVTKHHRQAAKPQSTA
jgi:hypothetical protein